MENKVTTKEALIKRILKERGRLSFFGVTNIGLFGSFVRDEQTPPSDIDILVEFAPEKHIFDNLMEVSLILEEILGRKVDVVTPEGLSPHIGSHILREMESVAVTTWIHPPDARRNRLHSEQDFRCELRIFCQK